MVSLGLNMSFLDKLKNLFVMKDHGFKFLKDILFPV